MSNRVLFLIECDATKTKSKVWENWSGWFAVGFSSTSVWSKKGAISSDQSQREVKQNQKIIPDYFQPSIELSFDKLTLATNLLTGVILSLNVIYYISHLLCVLWLVNFSVQLVKFQTLLVLKIFSLCLNPEINIANFVPTFFSWSVLWVMEACFSYHIYGH